MGKVYLRLLPFCFVLYFICYLDRANIGFAALTMNMDLGSAPMSSGSEPAYDPRRLSSDSP